MRNLSQDNILWACIRTRDILNTKQESYPFDPRIPVGNNMDFSRCVPCDLTQLPALNVYALHAQL
jgi:hypothetical protein